MNAAGAGDMCLAPQTAVPAQVLGPLWKAIAPVALSAPAEPALHQSHFEVVVHDDPHITECYGDCGASVCIKYPD